MPYIAHREELQPAMQTAGWNQIKLMNDEIAAELDADLELNVLAPNAATPRHYHTGCEHYIFIVKGQAELILEDGPQAVATGYLIAIDSEEHHALKNVGQDDLEYLEFFVPGSGATTIVEE